jgi:ribonuclease HII
MSNISNNSIIVLMIGIDEVGRGALAGPVYAAAVRLRSEISGLDDSKKLSKIKRQELSKLIISSADVGIGWSDQTEVDELGLTKAVGLAMKRAIEHLIIETDEVIIIDGNYNFLPDFNNVKTIIRADGSVACVSAASIVAKVARDNKMAELAVRYPNYGFEANVGYGTKKHKSAISQFGLCAIHRKSFAIL